MMNDVSRFIVLLLSLFGGLRDKHPIEESPEYQQLVQDEPDAPILLDPKLYYVDAEYYVDPRRVRTEFNEKQVGLELEVLLKIVYYNNNSYKPIGNGSVDIWFCDKSGNHVSPRGPARKEGAVQLVDKYGNVAFRTVIPLYFNPEATHHLHVEVHETGSAVYYAGIIYFTEQFWNRVANTDPYKTLLRNFARREPGKGSNVDYGTLVNPMEVSYDAFKLDLVLAINVEDANMVIVNRTDYKSADREEFLSELLRATRNLVKEKEGYFYSLRNKIDDFRADYRTFDWHSERRQQALNETELLEMENRKRELTDDANHQIKQLTDQHEQISSYRHRLRIPSWDAIVKIGEECLRLANRYTRMRREALDSRKKRLVISDKFVEMRND